MMAWRGPLTSRVFWKLTAVAHRPPTTTTTRCKSDLRSKLMSRMCCQIDTSACQKVTVMGAGPVGMACAYSLMLQRITGEICLIDENKCALQDELHDLTNASAFVQGVKIVGSTDLGDCVGSRVIVLAEAATDPDDDSTRLDNVRSRVAKAAESSPSSVLVVAVKPTDLAAHVAWKSAADKIPLYRVFGVGCEPDTARLRRLVSEHVGLDGRDVQAWVIGHRGPKASVACWSRMTVGGSSVNTEELLIGVDNGPERLNALHERATATIQGPSGERMKDGKVLGRWSMGMCASDIVRAIMRNETVVKSVSTLMLGKYGIEKEVFLSTPCVIDGRGIRSIIEMKVSACEQNKMLSSADVVHEKLKKAKVL